VSEKKQECELQYFSECMLGCKNMRRALLWMLVLLLSLYPFCYPD